MRIGPGFPDAAELSGGGGGAQIGDVEAAVLVDFEPGRGRSERNFPESPLAGKKRPEAEFHEEPIATEKQAAVTVIDRQAIDRDGESKGIEMEIADGDLAMEYNRKAMLELALSKRRRNKRNSTQAKGHHQHHANDK